MRSVGLPLGIPPFSSGEVGTLAFSGSAGGFALFPKKAWTSSAFAVSTSPSPKPFSFFNTASEGGLALFLKPFSSDWAVAVGVGPWDPKLPWLGRLCGAPPKGLWLSTALAFHGAIFPSAAFRLSIIAFCFATSASRSLRSRLPPKEASELWSPESSSPSPIAPSIVRGLAPSLPSLIILTSSVGLHLASKRFANSNLAAQAPAEVGPELLPSSYGFPLDDRLAALLDSSPRSTRRCSRLLPVPWPHSAFLLPPAGLEKKQLGREQLWAKMAPSYPSVKASTIVRYLHKCVKTRMEQKAKDMIHNDTHFIYNLQVSEMLTHLPRPLHTVWSTCINWAFVSLLLRVR